MHLKMDSEKITKLLEKVKYLKVLIPIIGIVVANLELWEFIKIAENINKGKAIIYTVIVNLIIIYLCFVIYKERKRINDEVQILKDRNDSLTQLNDGMRTFKHDFYNIIQAIDGYILIGDMQALKKYFSKLLDECNHVKNLELLTAKEIKNPAIYGVLLNKYKKAEDNKISMNIETMVDLENIGDLSYKLSRILGILLDNAIEAALECEKKVINIQISQTIDSTAKTITIENTYLDKEINTETIYEKEFSTKKLKGNSGLGLWKVRELICKDSKLWLQTSKSNEFFKQKLELYV